MATVAATRSATATRSFPLSRFRLTDESAVVLLLFIVLGAYVWITPAQNDTWWHLRSGREMWETGSLLWTEHFSHTGFGRELNNHWWLTQLAFYGVYTAGGALLLTIFAGVCAFASVIGSWRLIRGTFEVRLGLLLFLLIATAPEWAVRPQVISLALLALAAHLIARDRLSVLPLVCIIWANTHALVVFGVLMGGAAVVEAAIWSRDRFRRDVIIAACCAAAPLVSPAGWHYWPEVFRTVTISRALQLHEYRAPIDAGSIPFWIAVAALAILTFVHRAHLAAWRRGDRILLICAVLLAIAAVGASRNIAFFAVIAAPVLARLLTPSDIADRRVRRPASVFAYVLLAAGVLASTTAVAARWRDGGERLGWRPLSAQAIQAVRRCPDPIFNHLEDGGYLMWMLPTRRVFVDSRMEAYPLELLKESQAADVRGDYTDLFRKYHIRCAIVATDSPLKRKLALDTSLSTVYWDAHRTVFARSDTP